jgi:hypothetical protein
MYITSNIAEEKIIYKLHYVPCYKQGQRLQQLIPSTDVLTHPASKGISVILGCIDTVHSPTNALLLNLEEFKIYIKIHINIAATCFGLRPSSGSVY